MNQPTLPFNRLNELREKYRNQDNQTQKARVYRMFLIRSKMRTEELKQAGLDVFPSITAADQIARFLRDEGLVKNYQTNGSKTKTWELVR